MYKSELYRSTSFHTCMYCVANTTAKTQNTVIIPKATEFVLNYISVESQKCSYPVHILSTN